MTTSALFYRSWTLAKDGLTPSQNEDAFRLEIEPTSGDLLIAMADGATEAVYSGRWARTLVEAAAAGWPMLDQASLESRLDAIRSSFKPFDPQGDVPWYVRNKYQMQGSQATLLVGGFRQAEHGAWALRALSVGDTCLLLLRQSGDACSFPVSCADDFDVCPALVSTSRLQRLRFDRIDWTVQPGDALLVSTDAVARWFLQCLESCQSDMLFDFLYRICSSSAITAPATPKEPSGFDTILQFLPAFRLWWNFLEPVPDPAPSAGPQAEPPSEDGTIIKVASRRVLREAGPFQDSIESYRPAERTPRLRNDDSTLAVCIPLKDGNSDPAVEVLSVLERLRAVFSERFAPTRALTIA